MEINLKVVNTDGSKETLKDSNEAHFSAENIKYEGTKAIYTNPVNGNVYEWNETENKWIQRIETYSIEDGCHVYTDNDGTKFFWDAEKKAWFPKIDDDFMAVYQMNYGSTKFDTNVDNFKQGVPEITAESKQKLKDIESSQSNEIPKKCLKTEPCWFNVDETQNTSVYVSNLPSDITEEEFVDLMQKCGLVMRDPDSQQFKIKLYRDSETNDLKGDALCKYIKIESVELALSILDGKDFKGKKLKVEKAKFQMKGEYNPKLKPKPKKKKDKLKLKRKQEKLFDWRPEKSNVAPSKFERVVVVKNLFEPKMFDTDVELILEIQEDLREECGKLGTVKKVVIHDRHPEGVAQVFMSSAEEAKSVIDLLENRWFMKRKLSATIWDGRTKYNVEETDSEISLRINQCRNARKPF